MAEKYEKLIEEEKPTLPPEEEKTKDDTLPSADNGLVAALEALRNQPGRRALLSATKNMTEAQVLRFADWLADITGSDKD